MVTIDGVVAVPSQVINTKNCKGMYELAKALAIQNGPRRFMKIAGYALTYSELRALYIEWGFSMKRPTMKEHLRTWEEIGWAKHFNVGADGSVVYFFLLNEKDPNTLPMLKSLTLAYPDMEKTSELNGVVLG